MYILTVYYLLIEVKTGQTIMCEPISFKHIHIYSVYLLKQALTMSPLKRAN